MFEYDSEEIAYTRELLRKIMDVPYKSEAESLVIEEIHKYLNAVGYCCNEMDNKYEI